MRDHEEVTRKKLGSRDFIRDHPISCRKHFCLTRAGPKGIKGDRGDPGVIGPGGAPGSTGYKGAPGEVYYGQGGPGLRGQKVKKKIFKKKFRYQCV